MCNLYHQAKFLLSAPSLKKCPPDKGYEIVFCGRSNVGKSSVINCITSQKKLAKTSRTSGKTQHFVFFELDTMRKLVDLPGYGYAKVAKSISQKWHKNINEYFNKRQCLQAVILIMDCRHPLKDFDKNMLNWCINNNIKTHILLSKADKLTKGAASNVLLKIKNEIKEQHLISAQLFSSLNKLGLNELRKTLSIFLKINPKNHAN